MIPMSGTASFAAVVLCLSMCLPFPLAAQQTLLDVDTTRGVGKMFLSVFQRFDQLRFSGYIQTQFQVTGTKGAETFAGGNFAAKSDNRFMLRRARMRMDYAGYNENREPNVYFVFQFDGTERGVNIRDFWGRIFDTRWRIFSLTTGMFARPMGYELSLSSSDRESPERGRMSQILMPTERDLGMMLTFQPRGAFWLARAMRVDVGVFNGQGLAGPTDFDSYKDIIGRITLQPELGPGGVSLSLSLASLQGAVIQTSRAVYAMGTDQAGRRAFLADSSDSNRDAPAPRRYYNMDAQLRIDHGWGSTELRVEYLWGQQPGTATSTRSEGSLPTTPTFRRRFDGGYFYLLHNVFSPEHQLVFKYDWYDPNTGIEGGAIGLPGTLTGAADVRYSTVGLGYVWYATQNLKAVLYYDWVTNELTQAAGFESDLHDNVLTCRLQYRF